MRACRNPECEVPLREKDGDQHEVCPVIDRAKYLDEKRRRLPGLVAHQERLQRGEHPFRPEGEGTSD